MSHFMQSIVQEVLSRNKTPENRERKEPERTPGPSRSESNRPRLEEIHRPNYQRQKQQARIKVESPSPLPKSQVSMAERQTENPVYALQRLTTSQWLNGNAAPTVHGAGKEAQLIGKTKNNQLVWCFYAPDPRLEAIPAGCSTGFITGVESNPGTIFIVEEWMQQQPDVQWEWFGMKNSYGWSDTLKIQSSQSLHVEQVLKGIYNQLNRQAIRSVKSYFVEHPSDYLWASIPFSAGQSVSALVGLSAISSMAILDRYFHHHPQISFQFDIRDNHLLLCGDARMIQGAIQQLEADAGKLLS